MNAHDPFNQKMMVVRVRGWNDEWLQCCKQYYE
jgi:hypothetical protein